MRKRQGLQEWCVPEDIELTKETCDYQHKRGQGRKDDTDDVPTDPVDAVLDSNNWESLSQTHLFLSHNLIEEDCEGKKRRQDEEVGDGTTSVIILSKSLFFVHRQTFVHNIYLLFLSL